MDEQGDIYSGSTATNVQMHEIKPVAGGMSFGAQLDKFYLSIEAGNYTADAGGTESKAEGFLSTIKKAKSK